MNLSKTDWVIVAVIVAAAGLILMKAFSGGNSGPVACVPVKLSPEVKAYIDSKFAAAASSADQAALSDLSKKMDDLENKLKQGDDLKELKTQLDEKSQKLQAVGTNQPPSALAAIRKTEVDRIAEEIQRTCQPQLGRGPGPGRRLRGRRNRNGFPPGFSRKGSSPGDSDMGGLLDNGGPGRGLLKRKKKNQNQNQQAAPSVTTPPPAPSQPAAKPNSNSGGDDEPDI